MPHTRNMRALHIWREHEDWLDINVGPGTGFRSSAIEPSMLGSGRVAVECKGDRLQQYEPAVLGYHTEYTVCTYINIKVCTGGECLPPRFNYHASHHPTDGCHKIAGLHAKGCFKTGGASGMHGLLASHRSATSSACHQKNFHAGRVS